MKVALIPLLYEEYNYGRLLQFYALQKAVLKLRVDAEILQVSAEKNICKNKPILQRIKSFFSFPKRFFYQIKKKNFFQNNYAERIKKTMEFKRDYYLPVHNYKKNENRYDAYICGSDQIWNPNWARERAFLSFAPRDKKRIIYAASIGCESLTNIQKKCFKPYIEKLDYVSVREHSAKGLLDSFVENKKIDVVLDPTLLLTVDEWNELIENVEYSNYLFVYFLGNVRLYQKNIIEFAKKKNLKIVNIACASFEKIERNSFGDIIIDNAGPRTFISLIKNASFVITDSFHASVFSVLYKKEFIVLKRSGVEMQGRIETLLKNFHLPSRIISKIDCDILNSFKPIDYGKNDLFQKEMMNTSYNFLKTALGV